MVEQTIQLITSLHEELEIIKEKENNSIEICKQALLKAAQYCDQFKEGISEYTFKNKEEEIFLFKELKPKLFSQLFYYNNLFKIECEKPNVVTYQKKFLEEKLIEIHRHFESHKAIYQYYRIRDTSVDENCFVRTNQGEIYYKPTGKIIYYNDNFLTINDLVFAYILANDLTERYLQFKLGKWSENYSSTIKSEDYESNGPIPEWKESKTALVETLYFLHASGGFGDADIKSIVRGLKKGFNIQLDDPYKIYNEIRLRNNKTKFIDISREKLLKKMKEDESNWKNYN